MKDNKTHKTKSYPSGETVYVRKSECHYKTVKQERAEQQKKAQQHWNINSEEFRGF